MIKLGQSHNQTAQNTSQVPSTTTSMIITIQTKQTLEIRKETNKIPPSSSHHLKTAPKLTQRVHPHLLKRLKINLKIPSRIKLILINKILSILYQINKQHLNLIHLLVRKTLQMQWQTIGIILMI